MLSWTTVDEYRSRKLKDGAPSVRNFTSQEFHRARRAATPTATTRRPEEKRWEDPEARHMLKWMPQKEMTAIIQNPIPANSHGRQEKLDTPS